MIKIFLFVFTLCGLVNIAEGQIGSRDDSIQATIVLIGDAGQLTNGRQLVVDAARKLIPMNKKTTVIYLGDNLYKPGGIPDDIVPSYNLAKAPLDSQINIAGGAPVNVYFIPGNHDWANGGRNGLASVVRIQNYIDILGNKYVRQLPRDGCPGPVEQIVNDDITLVLMDSQWWLQEYEKPGVESDCPYKTKAEVLTQLDDILARNDKKLVIFATHHPMRSYGMHGGFYTLKQHIFPFTDINKKLYIPLPLIGSAYPLTRGVFGTSQDLKHPLYREMITDFETVIKGHPNVIFVAGHEHTLQLIHDSGYNYIVSGSGSKTTRVSASRNTLFKTEANGFVTLDVSKNKTVTSNFYTVAGDSVKQAYSKNILDFSIARVLKPLNDTMRHAIVEFKDSAIISASDRYKHVTGFQNFFLGKNYREEWSTPVKLKVFNISKEQGGFKIKSLGGGKQTKSLKLEDKNGKEWTLRTIDKDPEKALPENLRGTIGQAIVVDVVSASSPYAPFVIPALAAAVGVPAAHPKFFFVPDDPAFGYYQPLFANTVCLLEERQPTPDETDTKSTGKIFNKLLENNNNHVDQKAVLRARLLDMLIGDFDRHADQWRWGTTDTGKGKLYYPVPKDRDQALFNSNGLLVKYLAQNQLPFLQGFKFKVDDINGFNFVARDFDRFFLNSLSKEQWVDITKTFTGQMTDEVIKDASSKYPPEIKKLDSAFTTDKLISRRNSLSKNALKYYKFLAKTVTITGSNEPEYFHISDDSGRVRLSVFKKEIGSDSSSLVYRRSFTGGETQELILYGLNGDDKFEIDKNVSSTVKLRIVGGKGKDTFDLKGNMRSKIYDLSLEKNAVINNRRAQNYFSADPKVLDYRNTGFQYNKLTFPQINLGFNAEDKLLLGLGFSKKTYGFRKAPYATYQKLTTLAALSLGAYQAKYEGVFNEVLRKNDIVVDGAIVLPTLSNFFGYGNESVLNKNLPLTYYRTRYKYASGSILIRKRFNDLLQFSGGPAFYRYWNSFEDNKARILSVPANAGKDSAAVFGNKQYFGAKVKVDINYVNSEVFPTRGITWFTTLTSMRGLNKNSRPFTDIQSDMTIYASISDLSKVSGVLRFGGGRIISDSYEFFQAKTLGVNSYLRGYRKDRFAGRGMTYGSTELRFRLFRSKSFVLPGDVGILGFADVGRVFQKDEESNKWHNSFGTGLYFLPFSIVAISAYVGYSPEDKIFNFSIGSKFNLNF